MTSRPQLEKEFSFCNIEPHAEKVIREITDSDKGKLPSNTLSVDRGKGGM